MYFDEKVVPRGCVMHRFVLHCRSWCFAGLIHQIFNHSVFLTEGILSSTASALSSTSTFWFLSGYFMLNCGVSKMTDIMQTTLSNVFFNSCLNSDWVSNTSAKPDLMTELQFASWRMGIFCYSMKPRFSLRKLFNSNITTNNGKSHHWKFRLKKNDVYRYSSPHPTCVVQSET